MIDVDTIEINNVKYMVVGEIDNYVYLANIDNPSNFLIKKEIDKDGEKYLAPIEDKEEFKKALGLFTK